MDRQDGVDTFQFDNNLIGDQKIQAISTVQSHALVRYIKWELALVG
jgi:hypothetical protein